MTKKKEIEMIYLGQRLDVFGGKTHHHFREKGGKARAYSGLRGNLFFGSSYIGYVDGTINNPPKSFDPQTLSATDQEEKEFEAAKIAIAGRRVLKRKAMELAKPHPDITQAIRLLRPFCGSMDYSTFRSFMEYVKNEVSKKKKKGRK